MIEADRLLNDEDLIEMGFQAKVNGMLTAARWAVPKRQQKSFCGGRY